ncbi:hypothetical protein CKK33_16365 [Mucilaginibacter sp. MD40]|uniref:hypothetical protein n=1 Tax=Mucilaginibacter sp. MD40 TaxID=2029590 RepID=UPI000BAC64BE|nr:hypothetical protein [Mucilaginibacter sp. MD40]PAW94986.1 hypothetical protein CKK33_16365 [Mucilaginibacter sp. MD40]
MIEKNLATGNSRLRVCIPSHLHELSLGQMIALQNEKELSDIQAISILSGVPANELMQITNGNELLQFTDAILSLSHQIKNLYNSDAIPKDITLVVNNKSVKISVSGNLAIEPAGAFMASRDIIADEIAAHIKEYGEEDWQQYFNPSLQACGKILAQYFYCKATAKPYDEYEAADFFETIKELRVTEALPIAKHFFTVYPNLWTQRTGYWRRLLRLLKNALVYRRSKSSAMLTR